MRVPTGADRRRPMFYGVSDAPVLASILAIAIWTMRSYPFWIGGLGVLFAACAPQGLPPPARHPSAAEQEALARAEETAAQEHLTAGNVKRARCTPNLKAVDNEPCWTPTSDTDRVEAIEHLRLAQEHRAASQALRDAEARACTGLSQEDRDVSPFAHTQDIIRVEPIGPGTHLEGARVFFGLVQGLSRPRLQQIVDCHIARADAVGHDMPEESFSPLVPPNVKALVRDATDGFVVDVTSDDPEAAREVLRRAQALKKESR